MAELHGRWRFSTICPKHKRNCTGTSCSEPWAFCGGDIVGMPVLIPEAFEGNLFYVAVVVDEVDGARKFLAGWDDAVLFVYAKVSRARSVADNGETAAGRQVVGPIPRRPCFCEKQRIQVRSISPHRSAR